jgi:uncharacterized protein (TIGR02246 family)
MRILTKIASRVRKHAAILYAVALMMLPLEWVPAIADSAEDASRVVDRWVAGYRANDPSAVLKLYASDAILFGIARPIVFDGTKPISTAFDNLPESGNTVRICRRQVLVVGADSVLITGIYQFHGLQHGAGDVSRDRFTMLIVKRGDEWQISYHTTSHRWSEHDFLVGRTASIGQTTALPIAPAAAGQDSADACLE